MLALVLIGLALLALLLAVGVHAAVAYRADLNAEYDRRTAQRAQRERLRGMARLPHERDGQ